MSVRIGIGFSGWPFLRLKPDYLSEYVQQAEALDVDSIWISDRIVSQGKRGVIVGDAIHHPSQVQETDWSPLPDFDPELSRQTRREFMDAIERDGSIAVSGHFPIPGFGRLLRLKDRRYWEALK